MNNHFGIIHIERYKKERKKWSKWREIMTYCQEHVPTEPILATTLFDACKIKRTESTIKKELEKAKRLYPTELRGLQFGFDEETLGTTVYWEVKS